MRETVGCGRWWKRWGQYQSEPVHTVNMSKAGRAAGRITSLLPGWTDTAIMKVVLLGRVSLIALWVC